MPGKSRGGDRHRHPPIAYRPPEAVREKLLEFAARSGRPASRVITDALTDYLDAQAAECTHAYPDVRTIAGRQVCRICG